MTLEEPSEVQRIWDGFRDELNLDILTFDSPEELERFLREAFDKHPSIKRIKEDGREKLIEKAIEEWSSLLKPKPKLKEEITPKVKEEELELLPEVLGEEFGAPPERMKVEKVKIEEVPTIELPEIKEKLPEFEYPRVEIGEEEIRKIKEIEQKVAERTSSSRINSIINTAVSNTINTVKNVTNWVVEKIKSLFKR